MLGVLDLGREGTEVQLPPHEQVRQHPGITIAAHLRHTVDR